LFERFFQIFVQLFLLEHAGELHIFVLIESEIQKNPTLSRSGEQSGLQLSFREVYGKTEQKQVF
jgi:hypothetical protein